MRYPTATAFRRALEDRLNRRARTTGEATMRLRKNVVFQRLLARLLTISPDRWLLKGGLALDFRLSDRGARPRATKDMDLARRGDLVAADADFQRAQDVGLGDHFELIVQRIERQYARSVTELPPPSPQRTSPQESSSWTKAGASAGVASCPRSGNLTCDASGGVRLER